MIEQERLEHGPQSYLWAEFSLPQPKPSQKLWFSPVLDVFTAHDPFTKPTKGALLCDEVTVTNVTVISVTVTNSNARSCCIEACTVRPL
jgi:hypothetical protein